MALRPKKDEPPISWGKKMLRASLRRQKDIPITIIEKDDHPSPSPSNAQSYPSIDRDSDPSFVPVPPSVDSSDDDEIAGLSMDCPVLGFKEKVLTWNQVTLDRACHEESSNLESMIIVRQDTNTEESTERRHTSSENTQKKKRGEATKKQKPKRMCKFCQEWQTHLTRHIQRKHKEEEEVILATRLPGKERERAFASMRTGGIFKANAAARLADKDATLYRERCQGSAATVMCTGCLGLFYAKNVFRHKKDLY